MSAAAIIAIAIAAVVILAALAFVTLARRSDVRGAGALSAETRRRDAAAREARPADEVAERAPTRQEAERAGELARYGTGVATVEETAVAPWSPPDPEAIGVSRRQFFNRATVTLMSASIGAFSAAGFVAFLWPTAKGGFGQPVNVGKLDDIKQGIRDGQGFFYAPSARTWITAYPADALEKARAVYPDNILSGMQQGGIVALYQKCPHLGCRVPQCVTSQWFECPCHGSQYNQVGEKKGGPAPRGMDRFPITIAGNGDVTVNTGTVVPGPAIGTNTTGQEAEGPHCITGGGEH
jgi:cytochrome b6-f complex iron-sulfur subunit